MNNIRNPRELAGVRDVTDLTDGEIKTIASFLIVNELRNPNARYLEIGVMAGSTIRYCKQYTKTTQFVGVDLFEDFVPDPTNTHISGTFRVDDIRRVVGDRATLIKGNSHVVLPQLIEQGERFNFIFIDGNHSFAATMQDFKDASQLVPVGGYVAFHNASSYGGPDFEQYVIKDGGPWRVCLEVAQMSGWKLVECVDRLKVFQKL